MQIVDIAYLPVRILLLHQTKQHRPAQTADAVHGTSRIGINKTLHISLI